MTPSRRTTAPPSPSSLADAARLDALRDVGLIDAAPDATLERLTRVAAELLDVPISIVALLEADREFFAAAHGDGVPWLETRVAPLSHSVCKHVVASEAPVVVDDGRTSELASSRRAARDLDVHAYAGVPLTLHDGYTLGAPCAIDTSPRAWSEHDVDTLRDVAEIAVDVLEARRATLTRDLHDRLTGLPVRSLFEELVARALARPGSRTAVIALGLDAFRLVNDAVGHEAGDRALITVAERLTTGLGDCDAVCRVAGDEFLVLCDPPAEDPDGIELAEHLRLKATSDPVELGEHTITLHATVGLAVAATEVPAHDMIHAALDALARTKAGADTGAGAPDPQRRRRAADRLRLHGAVAGAHERGELHLAYPCSICAAVV